MIIQSARNTPCGGSSFEHPQGEPLGIFESHALVIDVASVLLMILKLTLFNNNRYLANYILNGGDEAEFMAKFRLATSKGFDPKVHLRKVGLANQTTMYVGENENEERSDECYASSLRSSCALRGSLSDEYIYILLLRFVAPLLVLLLLLHSSCDLRGFVASLLIFCSTTTLAPTTCAKHRTVRRVS